MASTLMRINAATDLWGNKDNVQLLIDPVSTSFTQLADLIERTYQAEMIHQCPGHISWRDLPPYRVVSMLILSGGYGVNAAQHQEWREALSEEDLFDGCQLYVFQAPHPFHSDNQQRIPVPRNISASTLETIAPTSPHEHTAPLETAKISFGLLDTRDEGRVRTAELKAAILRVGLGLHELHNSPFELDDPQKPYMNFREWLAFSEAFPGVVALVAQRLGGVVTRGDAASPTRRGARVLSVKGGVAPGVQSRDMSPPRQGAADPEQRQRVATERLSSGLSSIATASDRQRERDNRSGELLHTSMEAKAAQRVIRNRPMSTGSSRARSPKATTASPHTNQRRWQYHR